MNVTDNLTVSIMPNNDHEFLMSTTEVAKGYGIATETLRGHRFTHKDELIENKHFVKGVCFSNTLDKRVNFQPHQILWTKQGVIRLGFFIKSERAKLFRDFVEQLALNYLEKKLPAWPDAPKRKHNRLTTERLLDIMSDVCEIDNAELRVRISNKLMGKA